MNNITMMSELHEAATRTMTDQIHPRTMTVSLADFYQGYSEHLET
jgi:hypothetical protein